MARVFQHICMQLMVGTLVMALWSCDKSDPPSTKLKRDMRARTEQREQWEQEGWKQLRSLAENYSASTDWNNAILTIEGRIFSIDVERALPYNQPIGFFAQLVDIYSLDGAYYALFTYPDLHHSGIFPLTHISFTLRCNEAIVEGIFNERRAEPGGGDIPFEGYPYVVIAKIKNLRRPRLVITGEGLNDEECRIWVGLDLGINSLYAEGECLDARRLPKSPFEDR